MQKTDTFKYRVQPFDDDFTGRLSLGILGKHILASAENHAGARGFDRLERDGHRLLWVLSRMVIEMDAWPQYGDAYSISTWIRRYYYYFTDRAFDVRDADDRVIGRVFTIWAMIDETTRQPQMLQELFGQTFDPYIDLERPCEVQPFSRIRGQSAEPAIVRTPYYSDIDENGHVNSIRYIEFILDVFPKEKFEDYEVSRVEITYNHESYSGDTLSIYCDEVAQDNYHVVIRKDVGAQEKPEGIVVCHSAVTFKRIKK